MQSHMLIFKKSMSKLNSMKMQVTWSIKHTVNLTVSSPAALSLGILCGRTVSVLCHVLVRGN